MCAQIQTRIFVVFVATLTLTARGGKPASRVDAQPIPQESYALVIDRANIVDKVDNLYMHLVPGTTFIYEGRTEKSNEHYEACVSSETKVILGVTCVVIKKRSW
jgi:hypothetical protein